MSLFDSDWPGVLGGWTYSFCLYDAKRVSSTVNIEKMDTVERGAIAHEKDERRRDGDLEMGREKIPASAAAIGAYELSCMVFE
jgi:hypothetical protein